MLTVADKDGGAHVDDLLPEDYAALTRGNSLGFGQAVGGEPNTASLAFSFEGLRQTELRQTDDAEPLPNNIALASVRQISYELTSTLRSQLTDGPDGISIREPICSLPYADQPALGRNDPCPCGSGRKFKRCFAQRQARRRAPLPPNELPPLR